MNEIECRLLYWDGEPTNYIVTAYGDIYNIITWHKLTPCEDSSGRFRVCLTINGKCITTTVHKIVYIAFYGDYNSSLTINHIDEDFQNNYYENLEQVSREENCHLYRQNNGNPEKKYSDMEIIAVCKDLKSGIYYKDVAAAYGMPVQYVFNILKFRRRKFIVKDFIPFPESAHCKRIIRKIPHDYIESLIQQGYSNNEILQLLDEDRTQASDKYFSRVRQKLNKKSPSYFDESLLNKIDALVSANKSNKEIYKLLNLEYNSRNANAIARSRQKLQIMDFNPEGISLDIQDEILSDILNGSSNKDLEIKYNLDRTKYVINLFARLRQKAKKMTNCESSTTIEKLE